MKKISFRDLHVKDAEWLIEINDREIREHLLNFAKLCNKKFSIEDEKEWIRKKLREKTSKNIIILYNGEPAGIGEIRFKERYAEIGLWIRKKFWGKGLCKEIVRKLINIAKEKGFYKVCLDVDEKNIRARRCYESVGFEYSAFEEREIKYFNRWRNNLKMEYVFDFKRVKRKKHAKIEIKRSRDVNKAFEIHKNCGSINFKFYNPSKQEIEALKGEMYFAYYEGKEVGFMSLIERAHEIEIEWLAVHRDYQNRGIGSAMVEHALYLAKKKNKDFVVAKTSSKNERALRFYRGLGFQKYGFIANAYSWGDTQVILKRKL